MSTNHPAFTSLHFAYSHVTFFNFKFSGDGRISNQEEVGTKQKVCIIAIIFIDCRITQCSNNYLAIYFLSQISVSRTILEEESEYTCMTTAMEDNSTLEDTGKINKGQISNYMYDLSKLTLLY